MARNDGVDRTCARNMDVTDNDIGDAQAHNEREKEIYSNEDIIPERSSLNVHFKEPTGSYAEMFEQMNFHQRSEGGCRPFQRNGL